MRFFQRILAGVFEHLEHAAVAVKEHEYRRRFIIHKTAKMGRLQEIRFDGNIEIGAYSYFNSGRIQSGDHSQVIIGDWCAIGYNVNILAITHDTNHATGCSETRPKPEADIIIGNNVWIGSNVYIREGVTIGDNSVIGANAVVTRDVPSSSVVGGVPARIIRNKQMSAAA